MIKKMKKRRVLSIMTAVVMVLSVLTLPILNDDNKVYAATGMATIDIRTLGGTDADNDSDLETESNWYYDKTAKFLVLHTEGGNYTLIGTNADLQVSVNAMNVSVTLNGVNITGPSGTNAFGINNSYSCTMNLIGNNTLTGNGHTGINTGNNSECVITSSNSGSLNVNTILLSNNVDLRITGNADVKSIGTGVFDGISVYSTNSIFIGDNAKLTFGFVGGGGVSETHTFTKADAGTTHKWKLTDATTSNDMTDDSITVTVTGGTPGTVERESLIPSYNITVSASAGGTVSGGGSYVQDSNVVLTATPNSGYSFDGWYENNAKINGAAASYSFIATANRTLEARFIQNSIDKPSDITLKKQLSKPTGLKLTKNKASWNQVSNNNGYTLKVMQGKKTILNKNIKKNQKSYTFTKSEKKKFKKGKKYTVTLVAKGSANFTKSKLAKSKAVILKKK